MGDSQILPEYVCRRLDKITLTVATSLWGTEMVEIYVGSPQKKYVLHKNLICKASPFFEKMFNDSFEESETQKGYLKKESAYAFEIFVFRIYSNRFPEHTTTILGHRPFLQALFDFYLLADKILLPKKLKTEAIDMFIRLRASSKFVIEESCVNEVLASTAEDCPMRRLIIEIMCYDFIKNDALDEKWLAGCMKKASFPQVCDIVTNMKRMSLIKAGTEDPCEKLVRQKCSIANVPMYQTGYLKIPKKEKPVEKRGGS